MVNLDGIYDIELITKDSGILRIDSVEFTEGNTTNMEYLNALNTSNLIEVNIFKDSMLVLSHNNYL